MQLLVSVSNPTEARRAVDGGADVIDAKDPLNGALGAVSLDTLRQVVSDEPIPVRRSWRADVS